MISLNALLSLHNSSMTDFQMDRFVTVRSGGTPYGCLFQALRELHKRLRGIRSDYIERLKLEIKLQRATQVASGDGHKSELARIKACELSFAIEYCERRTKTDQREFLRFYAQAAALYTHLGFDRCPPTAETLARLEEERWEHHALCQVAESHINGSPPGNVVSMVQSMPADLRFRVLRRCFGEASDHAGRKRHLDALANWYLTYVPDVPEPLALSEDEAREVLLCCELSVSLKRLSTLSPMAAQPSVVRSISRGCTSASLATDAPA